MLWDKGIAEYVEAAHLLRAQGRRVRFLLAGTPDAGNPAAIPIETIQNWVRDGVVEWLGHVDDMAELYATVQIVALPSYREGLPKSLIEAAACGLPLVTTDVPGCHEEIRDGEDGLLVPARNAAALATAIARLIDDPELAQRFGAAARQKAVAEFDERIVINRTMAVYQDLLGEPG
jgi:glycosyltransferase involved in cell wall biosynthesis